jgi:hypothetical protein
MFPLAKITVSAGRSPGAEGREYWRGRDGKGGYRIDAVLRRYLDIIYKTSRLKAGVDVAVVKNVSIGKNHRIRR